MGRLLRLGLLSLLAGTAVAGARVPRQALEPGMHEHVLVTLDGDLRYAVAVPDPLPEGPVPLVLALHYGSPPEPGRALGFLQVLCWPAWKSLGAVFVAPEAPPGSDWTTPRTERMVLALLDHALAKWPVDRDRVVVTGFSMGGVGTWHLAARHPDRFAAAVPVAFNPKPGPAPRIPLYAISSTADTLFPIEATRAAVAETREAGGDATLVEVGWTHFDTPAYQAALRDALPWLRAHLDR